MRVRRIDRLEILLELRAVIEMLLPHLDRRVLHVGGGERLAVVPGDTFAQPERDRLPILCRIPADGEDGRRIALGVEIDERFHDLAGDQIDASRGPQGRIENSLFGTEMDSEDAAALRGRPAQRMLAAEIRWRQRRLRIAMHGDGSGASDNSLGQ